MSFRITWPTFSGEFLEKAKAQLTVALNSGKKPDNIAGDIIGSHRADDSDSDAYG